VAAYAWLVAIVRFDDLTPGAEHSFELSGLVEIFAAFELEDVEKAIRDAERAARRGRWVGGFVGYEAAPAFDTSLSTRPPTGAVPLVWFGVFEDRVDARRPEPGGSYRVEEWVPSVGADRYGRSVAAIRRRIAAGDTYQLNYTFRLRSRLDGDSLAFYADLLGAQRGGYGAYLDTGGLIVASASPELFFDLAEGRLTTRPMKGTAARGRWAQEDRAQAAALANSEKELAENLIIVDLLRNDLGRVSEFGSVCAESLFQLERYETVWQMTSTIRSRVRPDVEIVDVFGALFPCGSVTGAPKPRTMQLIAELEDDPRGIYCGAIGFIEPGGAKAVFSVPIRTVTIDPSTGAAEYGVGGGITWDSTPEGEHAEAVAKSRVLTETRPPFLLLETMLWDGRNYHQLDRHLDRLAASADYFRYRCDPAEVGAVLESAAAEAGPSPARVRLTLAPDGGIDLSTQPLEVSNEPVLLAIDDMPVDSTDPMLFHKTDARQRYDTRMARHPGVDDVIMVNERGEVTETTIANLVVRIDGRWLTPPLESGCLPGVHRAALLAEESIEERVLTPQDLMNAQGIAVVNSVRMWRTARLT